jgi:hypothetical protein
MPIFFIVSTIPGGNVIVVEDVISHKPIFIGGADSNCPAANNPASIIKIRIARLRKSTDYSLFHLSCQVDSSFQPLKPQPRLDIDDFAVYYLGSTLVFSGFLANIFGDSS